MFSQVQGQNPIIITSDGIVFFLTTIFIHPDCVLRLKILDVNWYLTVVKHLSPAF